MALTSAERKSFEKIVTQLTTSDRWFTWRTAPNTRRGLWLRRQVWHVIGTSLAVWGVVLATKALFVRSAVATGSAVARLARRMRARIGGAARHLGLWARASWQWVSRRKKPRF